MLALDISCGENKRQSILGLDIRKTPPVDIITDAHMLPFRDKILDYVLSSRLNHNKTLKPNLSHINISLTISSLLHICKNYY